MIKTRGKLDIKNKCKFPYSLLNKQNMNMLRNPRDYFWLISIKQHCVGFMLALRMEDAKTSKHSLYHQGVLKLGRKRTQIIQVITNKIF